MSELPDNFFANLSDPALDNEALTVELARTKEMLEVAEGALVYYGSRGNWLPDSSGFETQFTGEADLAGDTNGQFADGFGCAESALAEINKMKENKT